MKKFEMLGVELTAYPSALYRRVASKTVGVAVALVTLVLFGDTLLPLLGHGFILLGHGLHILYEIIESVAGQFLEWAFHLSKRQAEIIFFWSSLAIALYLSWYLSRKAHVAARRAYSTVRERRRTMAESAKITIWIRIALIISALSATLFLFS
jgi:hypothetical protein